MLLKKLFNKKQISYLFLIALLLIPFYFLLYKIYIPHTNSFGCFDECLNISAGYFMQYGRILYSEIFFNHQPNLAYLSFIIQTITNPQNLYELLLRHMQFVLFWSFIFNIFIIRRFRVAGIGFVIIYELSKYYFFGYRFLAESLIVYPMVYLAGLVILKFQNKKIYNIEYLLGAIFTWFVIFSREPFVPSILVLFALLVGIPKTKFQKASVVILVALSFGSLIILPFKEYFYSISSLNYEAIVKNEAKESNFIGKGIFVSFFYPIFILIEGKLNELRILLTGFSIIFITSSIILLFKKKYKLIIVVLIILGLSNLRPVEVATVHYQAFRMIPWFGIFLLSTFMLIDSINLKRKYLSKLLMLGIIITFIGYIVHPQNYITKPVDGQAELITNYGQTIKIGELVKILSEHNQTFFINQNDSIILSYWQSQIDSSYKYAFFGYVQPGFQKYKNAREVMMESNLPDFYYGDLNFLDDKKKQEEIISKYQVVYLEFENNGLYIKKTLVKEISDKKWQKAEEFGIEMPGDI